MKKSLKKIFKKSHEFIWSSEQKKVISEMMEDAYNKGKIKGFEQSQKEVKIIHEYPWGYPYINYPYIYKFDTIYDTSGTVTTNATEGYATLTTTN